MIKKEDDKKERERERESGNGVVWDSVCVWMGKQEGERGKLGLGVKQKGKESLQLIPSDDTCHSEKKIKRKIII